MSHRDARWCTRNHRASAQTQTSASNRFQSGTERCTLTPLPPIYSEYRRQCYCPLKLTHPQLAKYTGAQVIAKKPDRLQSDPSTESLRRSRCALALVPLYSCRRRSRHWFALRRRRWRSSIVANCGRRRRNRHTPKRRSASSACLFRSSRLFPLSLLLIAIQSFRGGLIR